MVERSGLHGAGLLFSGQLARPVESGFGSWSALGAKADSVDRRWPAHPRSQSTCEAGRGAVEHAEMGWGWVVRKWPQQDSPVGWFCMGSFQERQDFDSWKLSHRLRSHRDVPVWLVDLSECARKRRWANKFVCWFRRRSLPKYRTCDCGFGAHFNPWRLAAAERIRHRRDQRARSGSAISASTRMVIQLPTRDWQQRCRSELHREARGPPARGIQRQPGEYIRGCSWSWWVELPRSFQSRPGELFLQQPAHQLADDRQRREQCRHYAFPRPEHNEYHPGQRGRSRSNCFAKDLCDARWRHCRHLYKCKWWTTTARCEWSPVLLPALPAVHGRIERVRQQWLFELCRAPVYL